MYWENLNQSVSFHGMKILYLARTKPHLIDKSVKNISDYVSKSQSIDGFYRAFLELGCEVVLDGREFFFLNPNIAYKVPNFYALCCSILNKTKIRVIDNYFLSKSIEKKIRKEKIECVFTELFDSLHVHSINKLRKSGVKVTEWVGILPEMIPQRILNSLKYFSHIWCHGDITEEFKKYDIPTGHIHYIGNSYNNRLLYHDYDQRYSYDIVFIGNIGDHHSNRIEILESVAKSFESFAFFGNPTKRIPKNYSLQKKYKGYADPNITRKLYSSSKVAINLTLDNFKKIKKGFNERLFQIPACRGAVQAVKQHKNVYEFFNEHQLILFSDQQDLIKKIHYLLSHGEERKAIVHSAYKKNKNYQYINRVKKILRILTSQA
jgi:spore maturation protein CgeB